MITRTMIGAALAAVMAASAVSAGAGVLLFNNPPETSDLVPAGGWKYGYPYQRNARIDFATDPETWPADANQPEAKELTPGVNYQIAGTLDPQLYPSDWLIWATEVQLAQGSAEMIWLDTEPEIPNRQGMFGLAGSDALAGVGWKLDNVHQPTGLKHMWIEAEILVAGDGGWSGEIVEIEPDTAEVVYLDSRAELLEEFDIEGVPAAWVRVNAYGVIEPNPLYEVPAILLIANEQSVVLIDYLHIATECVQETPIPEPSGLLLLLAGALGLSRRRR
jgi:hypothetical protein